MRYVLFLAELIFGDPLCDCFERPDANVGEVSGVTAFHEFCGLQH